MKSLLIQAVAALLAAGCATAQRGRSVEDITCKAKAGIACPAEADVCFNNVGQTILSQGQPGSDWQIGLTQCVKDGSISFITWAPAVDGMCPPVNDCGDSKVEEIPAGATISSIAMTIPFGECTGDPICVYVHDGTYRKGKGASPQPDIPPSCYSSPNQLCEMCGPYLVTPQLPSGAACEDPFSCTTDACSEAGECVGTPDDSLCAERETCTEAVCVAAESPLNVGVSPVDVTSDGSGCGYKATTVPEDQCADGFTCTEDLCVALDSVSPPVGSTEVEDADGCVFIKDDTRCTQPRSCAVATCVADDTVTAPGEGCTTSEVVDENGVTFCQNKYRSCAAPVCVDAGGTPYADGFTDSDGCSVRSQADADAVCEASETAVECGEYKCSFEADASGNGCGLNAGLMFSGECDQGAACQEGICDDAGACSLQEAGSFCSTMLSLDCASAVCDPEAAGADANGCVVGVADSPDPCPARVGSACGTSTCVTSTGLCDDQFETCTGCDSCLQNTCTEDCPDEQTCVESCVDDTQPSTCTSQCEADDTDPTTCAGTTYDILCYKCGQDLTCLVQTDPVAAPPSTTVLDAIAAAFTEDCGGDRKTCNNQRCNDNNSAVVVASTCLPEVLDGLSGDCPCSKSAISNFASYTVNIVNDAVCSFTCNEDKCDQNSCIGQCTACSSTCLATTVDSMSGCA